MGHHFSLMIAHAECLITTYSHARTALWCEIASCEVLWSVFRRRVRWWWKLYCLIVVLSSSTFLLWRVLQSHKDHYTKRYTFRRKKLTQTDIKAIDHYFKTMLVMHDEYFTMGRSTSQLVWESSKPFLTHPGRNVFKSADRIEASEHCQLLWTTCAQTIQLEELTETPCYGCETRSSLPTDQHIKRRLVQRQHSSRQGVTLFSGWCWDERVYMLGFSLLINCFRKLYLMSFIVSYVFRVNLQ